MEVTIRLTDCLAEDLRSRRQGACGREVRGFEQEERRVPSEEISMLGTGRAVEIRSPPCDLQELNHHLLPRILWLNNLRPTVIIPSSTSLLHRLLHRLLLLLRSVNTPRSLPSPQRTTSRRSHYHRSSLRSTILPPTLLHLLRRELNSSLLLLLRRPRTSTLRGTRSALLLLLHHHPLRQVNSTLTIGPRTGRQELSSSRTSSKLDSLSNLHPSQSSRRPIPTSTTTLPLNNNPTPPTLSLTKTTTATPSNHHVNPTPTTSTTSPPCLPHLSRLQGTGTGTETGTGDLPSISSRSRLREERRRRERRRNLASCLSGQVGARPTETRRA